MLRAGNAEETASPGAALQERLEPSSCDESDRTFTPRGKVMFIGPASSATLKSMVDEIQAAVLSARQDAGLTAFGGGSGMAGGTTSPGAALEELRTFFSYAEFYSPNASVDDETITPGGNQTVTAYMTNSMGRLPGGSALKFQRTAPTDRALTEALMKELSIRGVNFDRTPSSTPQALRSSPSSPPAHILLISESDTPYGGAVPSSICSIVSDKIKSPGGAREHPPCTHKFVYWRGLDGGASYGSSKGKTGGSAKEREDGQGDDANQETKGVAPFEGAEGDGQSDYLKRLAVEIQLLRNNLREKNEDIGAIGIFGADAHDKILILKALRPLFPGVVFFTTDLDARFLNPGERMHTRNLVVTSAFGFALDQPCQGETPPFRSSRQTAQYLAALVALGKIENLPELTKEYMAPRIFEIARTRAVEMQSNRQGDQRPDRLNPNPIGLKNFTITVALLLLTICASEFRLLQWAIPKIPRPALAAGIAATLAIGAYFWTVHEFCPTEPFLWAEGVSAWPAEIIRAVSLALCIVFLGVGWKSLARKQKELNDDYFGGRCQDLREEGWKELKERKIHNMIKIVFLLKLDWRKQKGNARPESDEEEPRSPQTALDLWRRYLCQNRWIPRMSRILVAAAFFVFFAFWMVELFGSPHTAIRGDALWLLDRIILAAAVASFLLLLFFVLDATRLCRRLADRLYADTTWPDLLRSKTRAKWRLNSYALSKDDINRAVDNWLDVEFFSRLSEPVTTLIYYPFCILALMIAARSEIFEKWDTPPGLLIVFLFCFLFAIYCAMLLRHSAEKVRRGNLQKLNHILMAAKGAEKHPAAAAQLEQMIRMIESTQNGAFAPFTQQPFVKGLLLPFGSGGIVAIVDILHNFF